MKERMKHVREGLNLRDLSLSFFFPILSVAHSFYSLSLALSLSLSIFSFEPTPVTTLKFSDFFFLSFPFSVTWAYFAFCPFLCPFSVLDALSVPPCVLCCVVL